MHAADKEIGVLKCVSSDIRSHACILFSFPLPSEPPYPIGGHATICNTVGVPTSARSRVKTLKREHAITLRIRVGEVGRSGRPLGKGEYCYDTRLTSVGWITSSVMLRFDAWIGGLVNPASYIFTHILYLVVGSSSNVLSSKSSSKFNPHPYVPPVRPELCDLAFARPSNNPNLYVPTIMS
ncbi:hypothetical protein L211DRAFT_642125 [Terfezia boudieri ATCC MYA-4762]|uniref:Uncharacterized protein n=1 Tax=Terfezia boudieri ATCC MYA-4762 TaxID=1051890 RepID=A0A3N4L8G7_9PEZI|nr:hypothetical protein L211DRAFT_642125 [Terfezia boudieri ATCC MYA-4762]